MTWYCVDWSDPVVDRFRLPDRNNKDAFPLSKPCCRWGCVVPPALDDSVCSSFCCRDSDVNILAHLCICQTCDKLSL